MARSLIVSVLPTAGSVAADGLLGVTVSLVNIATGAVVGSGVTSMITAVEYDGVGTTTYPMVRFTGLPSAQMAYKVEGGPFTFPEQYVTCSSYFVGLTPVSENLAEAFAFHGLDTTSWGPDDAAWHPLDFPEDVSGHLIGPGLALINGDVHDNNDDWNTVPGYHLDVIGPDGSIVFSCFDDDSPFRASADYSQPGQFIGAIPKDGTVCRLRVTRLSDGAVVWCGNDSDTYAGVVEADAATFTFDEAKTPDYGFRGTDTVTPFISVADTTAWTGATVDPATSIDVDIQLEATATVVPSATALAADHPVWLRHSRVFPAPTIDPDTGQPVDWVHDEEHNTDLGHLQVVVDGRDLTYFRGKRTLVTNWEIREPWGDWACELVFPAITPHDHPGSGSVAWLHDGAHVGLREIQPEDSEAPNEQLWTGMVISENSNYDETNQVYRVLCGGALIQSDLAIQTAGYDITERDIGYLIPLALNTVISRDYLTCPTVTTGVTSRSRGSGSSRMAWISDLLATATTSDGLDQWTIHNFGWAPRLLLKNRTDIHVTMRAGQPGLIVDLTRDASSAPRVIYGEGTRNDGMRWKNTKHPGARLTAAPVFPLDPDASFTPGGSDTGFAAFAAEMRGNGYQMYSGNTYDARDADEVRDAQRRGGVAVTGNVGATTWATVFAVGSAGGNLGNAYQAPISIINEVDPWTYNAEGAITGSNPNYDPFLLRVERYENFGEGVDLAHARSSARGELNRTNLPVWSGIITLKADPNEMSRWRIRAGMNFLLQGHHGIDRQLHIADVDAQWANGIVVLTVDQVNRDLLTLRELHDRNKDSATDPTRRPGRLSTRKRSRDLVDTITVWDGETGAGRIDYHAAAGGEWLVYKVRAGQVGTLSHITFTTTEPACEFAIGMFGKPVTSTQLTTLVGNPLSNSKPWDPSWDALFNLGMFAAWGGSDTPCGYSPGSKTDPSPVRTGKLIDNGGVSYYTDEPGWFWVAEFVAVGCYMQGQINAEPEGV